jgi:hypothetical protein
MDLGSLLIMIGVALAVAVFLARPLMEERAAPIGAEEHQLSVLQAERDNVLMMIREIEMDHAMGKIGPDDFQAQRAALVARGSDVLRRMDALGGSSSGDALDAAIEAAVAAKRGLAPAGAAGFCTRGGQELQAGELFCARCGTRVTQETGA